jgi:hypothetical protein
MPQITTRKGHSFTVDDEDYARVSETKWHSVERPDGSVYARNISRGYLQRFIVGANFDDVVEFNDGDSTNCRRSNLRITNRTAVQKRVHDERAASRPARYLRQDRDGRWSVIIPGVGYIGRRDTAPEAAELRDNYLEES